jgi:hypothetical protein
MAQANTCPRVARCGCGRVPARDVPAGDATECVVEWEITMFEYIDILLWCALIAAIGLLPFVIYFKIVSRRDAEKKRKEK